MDNIAYITKQKRKLMVKCPYSFMFDDYCKLSQPNCVFDINSKVWTFPEDQLEAIINILEVCFDDVIVDLGNYHRKTTDTVDLNFNELFNILDKNDIKSIYRLLSKKYHPDTGGNEDTMKYINLVFEKNNKLKGE